MSFIAHGLQFYQKTAGPLGRIDPLAKAVISDTLPKSPTPPPGPPNPNDAANAAQSLTDAMRMRRGLLSNIYAGSQTGQASQPAVGKTTLGT